MAIVIGRGYGIPFMIASLPIVYTEVSDGLIVYRHGVRGGHYVLDKSTDGGVTWELDLFYIETDEELATILAGTDPDYRTAVRSDAFKLDHVLTGTGFAGIEDTDWENVYSTNTI